MEILRSRNDIRIFTLPNIVVPNIQLMPLSRNINGWFRYSSTFGKQILENLTGLLQAVIFLFMMKFLR